jgi:hypothetical protein
MSSYDEWQSSEHWQSLEPSAAVAAEVGVIDLQIGELMRQWETAPHKLDGSRRIALLFEKRFELVRDEASLVGALFFYQHINEILWGSDPAIVRKVSELELKRRVLRETLEEPADVKKAKAELLAKKEIEETLFGGKDAAPRVQFW